MSLLPSRLEVSPSPDEPKVLDIDGEGADAAFDALGSETAREVLATIYDEPRTPTEVRESVGTSLQNVHYHLDRLEEAGLIEPAGMGYSEKGNEMTVYGPASEAVVLFAGRDNDSSRLRDTLQRLFGLFFVVSLSTLVFAAVSEWLRPEPVPQPRSDDVGMMAESQSAADTAASSVTAVDPLLAFFLGGCVVVAAIGLVWGLREYRARKTASA
ncbi:helix-turn-helix domain-containing protein [Natronomonas gomsonensis]|uniref:ArsR/SmtB family transcription factor n=1 Tax=Natronomonas gomsonensis TaxID=1046043 RepID=UPI0020CA38FA|nr:winged helix-turn-helix domain-containing protein [Natronomonas gomsonensis]MCY4730401.1 helix-turn-helix domain-containing protein [Natronomonas gomsonensis]